MKTFILFVTVLFFYAGCKETLILSDLIDGKNSFRGWNGYSSEYGSYDIQKTCCAKDYLDLYYSRSGIEANYVLKKVYDEFTIKLDIVFVDAVTPDNSLQIIFNGQKYNIINDELRTGERLYYCGDKYEDFSYEFAWVFKTPSKTNVATIVINRAIEYPTNFYIRNLRIYEGDILKNPEKSLKFLAWLIPVITVSVIIIFWILYRKNEKFSSKIKSIINSIKKCFESEQKKGKREIVYLDANGQPIMTHIIIQHQPQQAIHTQTQQLQLQPRAIGQQSIIDSPQQRILTQDSEREPINNVVQS